MKSLRYSLLLATFIAGCQQATPPSEKEQTTDSTSTTISQDQLIIPGKSIGLTHLNEDAQNVIKRLGKPDAADAAMGKAMSTWYTDHDPKKHQTTIYTERQMGVDETSRVKQIRITSPWFSTAESICVGSSLADINRYFTTKNAGAYTENGAKYNIYTTETGITFETGADSSCTGIIVHDTGKDALSTYIPFHPDAKKTN